MIIKNKRFLTIVPICITYIVIILLFVKLVESEILIQAFTDKVFVYFIFPPFICGVALIEESIQKPFIVRMQNREKALSFLLIQQYLFGFLYLVAWFILIALFVVLYRETLELSNLAETFIRYLLCMILFLNVSACLKRSNKKVLMTIPLIISYAILLIDILVLTSISSRAGITIYLLFSWTFFKNKVLGIMVLLLLGYLSYICLKRFDCKADFY